MMHLEEIYTEVLKLVISDKILNNFNKANVLYYFLFELEHILIAIHIYQIVQLNQQCLLKNVMNCNISFNIDLKR